MLVKLVDRPSALGKVTRTPQGGARVSATLARVGVMDYFSGGKLIRQYTPPEVLAAAAASAADAPVTHHHPKGDVVDRSNYAAVSRGHVSGAPRFDAETGMLVGELVIQDAGLLDAIEVGDSREISMGYSADIEEVPGVTPDGQAYDWVRRSITYNHAAVLPAGRAGRNVRLLLDSEQNSILDEEDTMKIVIDGLELTDAAAVQKAIEGLCAKRDVLTEQVATLTAKLADATDPAKLEKLVADGVAAKIKADADAAAKVIADKLIVDNLAKAKAAFPKRTDLDSRSPDYIQAVVDQLTADVDGSVEMAGGTGGTPAPEKATKTVDAEDEEVDERTYFSRVNADAWNQPIPGAARAK